MQHLAEHLATPADWPLPTSGSTPVHQQQFISSSRLPLHFPRPQHYQGQLQVPLHPQDHQLQHLQSDHRPSHQSEPQSKYHHSKHQSENHQSEGQQSQDGPQHHQDSLQQQQQPMRGQHDAIPLFPHLPHLVSPLPAIRSAPHSSPGMLPYDDLAPLDLSRGRPSHPFIAAPIARLPNPCSVSPRARSPLLEIARQLCKSPNRSPLPLNRSPLPFNRSPLPEHHSPQLHNRSPLPLSLSPLPPNRSPLLQNKSPLPLNRSPLPQSWISPQNVSPPQLNLSPYPDQGLGPHQKPSPHSEGSLLSRRSPNGNVPHSIPNPQPETSRISVSPSLPRNTSTERLALPKCSSPKGPSPNRLSPHRLSPSKSPNRLSPNRLSPNRLSPNRLSPNKLSPNRSSCNRLSPNRLSSGRSPNTLSPNLPLSVDASVPDWSPLQGSAFSFKTKTESQVGHKACVSCGHIQPRQGDETYTGSGHVDAPLDLPRPSPTKRAIHCSLEDLEDTPPPKRLKPGPALKSILSNRERPYRSSGVTNRGSHRLTLTRVTKNHDSLVKTTNVIRKPLCHASVLPEGYSASSLLVPSTPPASPCPLSPAPSSPAPPSPALVVTQVRSLDQKEFDDISTKPSTHTSCQTHPVTSIYKHLMSAPQPKKSAPEIWSPLHLDLPASPKSPCKSPGYQRGPGLSPFCVSPARMSPHPSSPRFSPHPSSPLASSSQSLSSAPPCASGASNVSNPGPHGQPSPPLPISLSRTSAPKISPIHIIPQPTAESTADCQNTLLTEEPMFSPALQSPFSPVRFQFSPTLASADLSSGSPVSPGGPPANSALPKAPSAAKPPFSPGSIGFISCTIKRGSEVLHLTSQSKLLDSNKPASTGSAVSVACPSTCSAVSSTAGSTSSTAGSACTATWSTSAPACSAAGSSNTAPSSSNNPSPNSQKLPIKNPWIFNKWFENLERFMLQALQQKQQGAAAASPSPNKVTIPVSASMVSTPTGLHPIAPNNIANNIAFIQTPSGALVAGQNPLVVNSQNTKTVRTLLEQQRQNVQVQVVNNSGAPQTVRVPLTQSASNSQQAVKGFIDLTDDAGSDDRVVKNMQPATVILTSPGTTVPGNSMVLQSVNQSIRPQNTVLVSTVPTTQLRGAPVIVQRAPVTLAQPNAIRATITNPVPRHPAPLPVAPQQKTPSNVKKMAPPRPSLKISRVQQGIVLSWNMAITNEYSDISNYQLFAYQEQNGPVLSTLWKKVGDVRALPLPMACTLTQFQEGNKYHFAVRAVDTHGRIGPFSVANSIHLVANADS